MADEGLEFDKSAWHALLRADTLSGEFTRSNNSKMADASEAGTQAASLQLTRDGYRGYRDPNCSFRYRSTGRSPAGTVVETYSGPAEVKLALDYPEDDWLGSGVSTAFALLSFEVLHAGRRVMKLPGIGTTTDAIDPPEFNASLEMQNRLLVAQSAGTGEASFDRDDHVSAFGVEGTKQVRLALTAGSLAPANVRLWVNAFIARDVPGVTKPVKEGPYKGQTMIGALPWNDCWLTDNRSWSPEREASCRVHAELELDLYTKVSKWKEFTRCDASVEIDCEDFSLEASAHALTNQIRWEVSHDQASDTFTCKVHAAANNGTFRGSPDIDFTATFTIDFTGETGWRVTCDASVDAFPHFEAYAKLGEMPTVTIFQLAPQPGRTPANLFGGANRKIKERVTLSPAAG